MELSFEYLVTGSLPAQDSQRESQGRYKYIGKLSIVNNGGRHVRRG